VPAAPPSRATSLVEPSTVSHRPQPRPSKACALPTPCVQSARQRGTTPAPQPRLSPTPNTRVASLVELTTVSHRPQPCSSKVCALPTPCVQSAHQRGKHTSALDSGCHPPPNTRAASPIELSTVSHRPQPYPSKVCALPTPCVHSAHHRGRCLNRGISAGRGKGEGGEGSGGTGRVLCNGRWSERRWSKDTGSRCPRGSPRLPGGWCGRSGGWGGGSACLKLVLGVMVAGGRRRDRFDISTEISAPPGRVEGCRQPWDAPAKG
jgi:hypothetical protein